MTDTDARTHDDRALKRAAAIAAGGTGALAAALAPASADAATLTVTNLNDAGAGSLRQAILDANATTARDNIVFNSSLSGTINLASDLDPLVGSAHLDGPGADRITINGSDTFRTLAAITPTPAESIKVDGLRLANGGGGAGGGLYTAAGGTLRFEDMTITGALSGVGGGVVSQSLPYGSSTFKNVTISGNTAGGGVGGGAVFVGAGLVDIVDSTISGNNADAGGGFLVTGPVNVELRRSAVSGNRALVSYGGGFVVVGQGSVTASASTVNGNSAVTYGGGGFADAATITIEDSTVSGNASVNGGGGLLIYDTIPSRVVNSTITGNTANTIPGGTVIHGGGIYAYGAGVEIESSTVTGNRVLSGGVGGGVRNRDTSVLLHNSVVQGNTGGPAPDISGPVSAQFNMIGSQAGAQLLEPQANIIGGNPGLGPLAGTGGPTQTRAIQPGSPLINAGDPNDFQLSDQRGEKRPGGAQPDIGAYELIDEALMGVKVNVKKSQKVSGKKLKIKVKAGAAEATNVAAKGKVTGAGGNVKLAEVTGAAAAGAQATLTLKPSKKGSKKISKALGKGKKPKAKLTVTVADTFGNTESVDATVTLKGKGGKKGKKGK